MMIEIKFNNKRVGRIDEKGKGRILAGTPAFVSLWREFQRDGIAVRMAPRGRQKKNVLADAIEHRKKPGLFAAQLQRMGYTIEEKAGLKKGGVK